MLKHENKHFEELFADECSMPPSMPSKTSPAPHEEHVDVYTMLSEYLATIANDSIPMKERDTNTMNSQVEKGKIDMEKQPTPQEEVVQKNPCQSDGKFYKSDQIAQFLLSPENPNKIIVTGSLEGRERIIFQYADGCYRKISLETLRGITKQHFVDGFWTRGKIEQVIYDVKTELPVLTADQMNCDEDVINFANGIFHFSSKTLTEHTPEVYSTIQIPYNYIPGLTPKDAPVFYAFLSSLTGDDIQAQVFILEYIGAVLSNVPGFHYKKALVLYGEGNTGKSQLFELIQCLVGHENCHSLDLDKMENRFGSGQVYGKRFVGSADLPATPIKDLSVFKAMTGGDYINCEFKGEAAFSFRYRGFLMYCCNRLPKFSGDRGKHVYDRFNIIHCKNKIPDEKQDKTILDKMLNEAETIICIALRYFWRTVERGYRFTESEAMKQLRKEYAAENNTVIQFFYECCDRTQGRTKRSDVFEAYAEWCKKNNVPEEPKQVVTATLRDEFGIVAFKSGEYYFPFGINWPSNLSVVRKRN